MIAAYRHAAKGGPLPWALELRRYCLTYNALPENQNGGILAQDPYILQAMTAVAAGEVTGSKPIKAYDAHDWKMRRFVDVTMLLEKRPSPDYLTKRLRQICGHGIIVDGKLNEKTAVKLGIGDCIEDIENLLWQH